MYPGTSRRGSAALILSLLALGPWACTDYFVETTVNADGSGVRVERIEVSENEDVEASEADYALVMHTTPEDGWAHSVTVDSDGDTVQVFDRRLPVKDLSSWSGLSERFKIDGTTPAKAGTRLGYVTLGEVRFRNAVRVGRGEVSDGTTTFSYRETFTWTRAVDALVEFFMVGLDEALAGRYPLLSQAERGQVVGFARARYWVALEEGLLGDDSNEEQMLTDAARRTAEQAVKSVRVRYPGEEEDALAALIREVLLDDDRFITFTREMPGLDLAFNAHVVFRLRLPGTVTDSNAHKRDGTTLVWEFGPADALLTPIEIYAESVMGK
ncbi:MAG: hypothetical protein ACWGSQ_08510 [Longimicrobiales bacterium]